jgi:uncharacterized integral membrane protein (TIGR00698 family)
MALPAVSSPAALLAGFIFSILFGNPFPEQASRAGKALLKLSVIGLGFGINIGIVIDVGIGSLLMTLVSITATILLGEMLGRVMKIGSNTRTLLAFGTAICGGSAIAAIAPVIKARDEEIAVSLATVFTLNALALVLFPPLGGWLNLSQEQFGLWAALAIHDTSSVVGAAAVFGSVALTVGTTVKLTRALWIAPCTVITGLILKSSRRPVFPLFILGFIIAACMNSWLPALGTLWSGVYAAARQVLIMTLFLIGSGLTRGVLSQVGIKPLALGILLWVAVSVTSLLFISAGVIG